MLFRSEREIHIWLSGRPPLVPVPDIECRDNCILILSLLDKAGLKALPLEGEKWYEIDDMQDLDIAETLFGKKEGLLPGYQKRYGGYWRFPFLLDFAYLVNPHFPTERMLEELKANFDKLLRQYPSGSYVNRRLVRSEEHTSELQSHA